MLSSDWPAGSQASELWSQSRSHTLLKRRLFSAGVTGTQTQQVSKRTHPFLQAPPFLSLAPVILKARACLRALWSPVLVLSPPRHHHGPAWAQTPARLADEAGVLLARALPRLPMLQSLRRLCASLLCWCARSLRAGTGGPGR